MISFLKICLLTLGLILAAPFTSPAVEPAPGAAASGDPLFLGDKLEKLAEEVKAENPIAGIVIGEVSGDQIKYYSAGKFGTEAIDVAPEHILFEIGSISKVFTSLMLAQAVQEGKASLTDPISRFLPANVQMAPEVGATTLEQLATHTSGFPRMPDSVKPTDPDDPYANFGAVELYAFLEHLKLPAGAHSPAYSNVGMGLVGHILTLIYGKSYEELLAEKITGPLGLKDTTVSLTSAQQVRFAESYAGDKILHHTSLGVMVGCGGIRSTASDLIRFGQSLIDQQSPLHGAWTTICAPRHVWEENKSQIGLGIRLSEIRGQNVFSHDGSIGGFQATWEVGPQTAHIVVALANSPRIAPEALIAKIYTPPPSTLTDAAKGPEVPLPAEKRAEYVGIYRFFNKLENLAKPPSFTVILDDAKAVRIRITGQRFLPVLYSGNDRFFNRAVAAEYQFTRGDDGRVNGVVLYQNEREWKGERTDQPIPPIRFLEPKILQDYVGRYALDPQRVLTITARGDQLFGQLTGQPSLPVDADGQMDHFTSSQVAAALTFQRDDSGAVISLVLHQNGRNLPAKRLGASSSEAKPR